MEKTKGEFVMGEKRQLDVAKNHPLFAGLDSFSFDMALSLFEGKTVCYTRGETVRAMGMPFCSFGIVLSGNIQVFSLDTEGSPIMMASVGAAESFGESLAYLDTLESPVLVMAAADSAVLWLDVRALQKRTKEGEALALSLSERLTRVLAVRALSQNDRIQILSKPRIRERILCYFSQCERRYGSRTFILPFDRASLAVYLGVNRAALSRELAKMKQECIIDFFRSSFRLL
jgi:CRP-like cAMP-binding protein